MLDCGQPDDGAVEVPTFDDMDWDGFPDIVLDPLDWVLSDSFQHEGLDDERTLKDYLDGLCDLDNQQQFDQFEQQQQQQGDATSPTSIFLEGSAKSPDEGSSTNIGFDDAIGKDDDGAGAFLQKEDGMTMMNGGGGGGGVVERWDSSSGSNHVGGDPERGSPKQGLGHLRPVTTGIPQDCGGVGGGGGAGSPGGGINSSRQVETGKIPSQLHQTCGEVEQQDGSQPRSSQLRSDDSPIGGENWRTTSSQVNNGIAVVSHPYPHPFAAQNGDNSPMIGAGSPESDDGGDLTAPAVAAGGKPNKRKKPDVDWEAIKDPEERRRQRRLAKNRHTAAVSRERKKAQMRTLEERVSKLEEDNAALRYWLQYREQELHSLTSHLASLPKGAGEGVVPNPSHGAGSEPAVLELSSDLATMLLELLLLVWPLAQMLAVVQRVLYAACISKRLSQLMGRECNDAKKLEAPGIAFLARKLSKRGLRCGVSVQYPEGYWHSRNFKNWWSRHYYIGQRVLGL